MSQAMKIEDELYSYLKLHPFGKTTSDICSRFDFDESRVEKVLNQMEENGRVKYIDETWRV